MIKGFNGKTELCKEMPNYENGDINLVEIAENAQNYLINNPRPALDYECRFGIDLMRSFPWPADNEHEYITLGDTDLRMNIEYGYMKEMAGNTNTDKVAAGVMKRSLGYLSQDFECEIIPYCSNWTDEVCSMPWATGKLLIALCDEFTRTKDEKLRSLCRGMFKALCKHSLKTEDGICYPNGNGNYDLAGDAAISDGSPYSPAMQPEAIAKYYETFRDEEALEFATGLAKGEVRNLLKEHWVLNDVDKLTEKQKNQLNKTDTGNVLYTFPDKADALLAVRDDGSFDHHSHMRGHCNWGIAHIAYLTGDKEIIEWSKKCLDFFLSRGTDYGWIPESMTYPRRSETCAVADVISIATYMAKCGYVEYYDTVERFVRNYIRKAQFFITDDYKKLYMERHNGDEGIKGLKEAEKIQGGFLGAVGINDRLFDDKHMDMMGCCAPEGMRSIYTVWKNTVTNDDGVISVNMNFSCSSPFAEVTSLLPDVCGMKVEAKTAGKYRIRPAGWADINSISATKNGETQSISINGGYIYFFNVSVGDVITVTYPVISFKQVQSVKNCPSMPDREITVYWRGNTVVDVQPHGKYLPFYNNSIRL